MAAGIPIHVVVFNAVQVSASIYAFLRGGAPERSVAMLMLIGAASTGFVALGAHDYRSVEWGGAVIDSLLLLALITVALYANRFWPMYVAALQLNGLAVHAVRMHDPNLIPTIYAWGMGQIAYPMIALLIIGVVRHERRQRQFGADRSWSSQSAAYS